MRTPLLIATALVLCAPAALAQTADRSDNASLVSWLNEARAERGLAPLREDPRLDGLAEGHSVDMAAAGYFSHVSPTQGSVENRAAAGSVRWRTLGENIAFNQGVRQAHEALMRSPGHYANITGNFRSVGLGIVRSGDGVYVTEVFATLFDEPGAQATPPLAPPAAPRATAAPPAPAARPAPQPAPQPGESDDGDLVVGPFQFPPMFRIPGMPGWAAPRAQGGTAQRAPSQRGGTRHCEIDTPLGHMSITVAGDGVDMSAFPCEPAAAQGAHPNAPRTPPRGAPRMPVQQVPVQPMPTQPMPMPSSEPLGAPSMI